MTLKDFVIIGTTSMPNCKDVTIFRSVDNIDPNGNLNGNKGDLCFGTETDLEGKDCGCGEGNRCCKFIANKKQPPNNCLPLMFCEGGLVWKVI